MLMLFLKPSCFFSGGRETRVPIEETLGQGQEPTTNSNQAWQQVGIELGPH